MKRSTNGGSQDSLRDSFHSSDDNSLQVSDDEDAVATTRLNTWLNGGSNEFPLQLGSGTISSVTPVNPFDSTTISTSNLPSPFSVPTLGNRPHDRTLQQNDTPNSPVRSPVKFDESNVSQLNPIDPPMLVNEKTPISFTERSRIPPSPPKSVTNPSKNVSLQPTAQRPIITSGYGSPGILKQMEPRTEDVNVGGKIDSTEQFSGSIGPPKPLHQRQRSVSWGEKPNTNTIPPKAPKLSPKLSPVPSKHFRGPSEFSLFSVLTQSDSEASINNTSNVKLDEVLQMNPLETEAETLILRVIEAQDKSTRQRANTAQSAILENIPDESVHLFMPQSEDVVSSKSNSATSKSNRLFIDTEEQQSNTTNRPKSNTDECNTTTQQVLSSSADSRNTISIPAKSNQRPPLPTLTRNATVEHKLANLTEALAEFHGAKSGEKVINNPALNLRTDIEELNAGEASAGQKLAKNANLIYRGRQKTEGKVDKVQVEDTSTHSGSINKPSNWNKVRAVTSMTKPKVDQSPTQFASVSPNSNNNHIQLVSGSVENHKKTDMNIEGNDSKYEPGNAMECGTAAIKEDKIENANQIKPNRKIRRSWKFSKAPLLNTSALRDFHVFVHQRRADFFNYIRFMVVVVIPALITSIILFYFAGNPSTGIANLDISNNGILFTDDGKPIDPSKASISWWLIFACVRQTLTFSCAQLLQVVFIDFLCLSTRFSVNVFGSLLTLFIVQSKGWPFIVFMWGVLNFGLLFGSSKFANHWFYWQDFVALFNERNPSGSVTTDEWYTRLVSIAVCIGFVVALKRLWLGLFLGRKTYANYAEDLTKLVDKILILCEVAALSREIEGEMAKPNALQRSLSVSQYGITREEFDGMLIESDDEGSSSSKHTKSAKRAIDYQGGLIVDSSNNDLRRVRLDQAQRAKIAELLGAWEEPDAEISAEEDISISGILQFRNSLAFLNNTYMFSIAWGETTARDRTIIGSQEVFGKLMKRSGHPTLLKFEVLAAVAKQSDGTLDHDKLKRIIRILRPDRDGNLSLLEFVKSVDMVYKEAKLLRASVINSEKIDRAFEKAFNIVFYILVACIILAVVGLNPLTLIVSLTSVIVGFAFMVGSASSKMFEGWLFILVRRPYNIGDRIHISNVENDVDPNGSLGWIVKDLTLFHTTAVYGMTGERATMSNGSLASSRVINMARSPKALIYIYLKFATDVPYEKIQIFEKALREFVKSRPREWANINGFRANKVAADLGYIEYAIALTHREAWQSITSIVDSKAEVSSFCLELSKKLDMRYKSPPLPVDLAFVQRNIANISKTEAIATETNSALGAKVANLASDESSGYKDITDMFINKDRNR